MDDQTKAGAPWPRPGRGAGCCTRAGTRAPASSWLPWGAGSGVTPGSGRSVHGPGDPLVPLPRRAGADAPGARGPLTPGGPVRRAVPARAARAPDVRQACEEALGPCPGPGVLPLRDVLGMVGAHEWRRRGVEVSALGGRVHPHFGVYAPIRGEYVDLVARAAESWPVAGKRAIDVGTGTGVLAFVLARRGATVIATDVAPRAVACARGERRAARSRRIGRGPARGPLPRRARRPGGLESALAPGRAAQGRWIGPSTTPAAPCWSRSWRGYPARSAMAVKRGSSCRIWPSGWACASRIAWSGWRRRPGSGVEGALETRPSHPRARDQGDPLHEARAAEIVRLLRLVR